MELIVQTNSKSNIKKLQSLGVKKIIVGSDFFSCRQAISLNYNELEEENNKNIELYVLVNALVEEKYIKELEKHLYQLDKIGIQGVLFQDFAVLQICKEQKYSFDCIYAPDTLNTNHQTLNYLQTRRVSGAFLAREIPLAEKQYIQEQLSMPCIMQVHGVEYMAYSKRKLLQSYLEITGKTFPTREGNITIQANNVEDACYLYEDQYGTHILSKTQLIALDILKEIVSMPLGYIESLYLNEEELLDVVSLYLEGIRCVNEGIYEQKKEQLVQKLYEIQPNVKFYHSFLFDQTVYKIADVRKREEDERSK
ncbi:MAG: U32 family peptidase [Coprobacillaceae bacterium]